MVRTARALRPVPETPPRALGYVRVSMAREAMISPALQRTAIEDHCARYGYVLGDVVEDLDASGRTFARAGIQRVIAAVEARDTDVIVVWKYSRFGRHRRDWAVNLDRVESVGGRLESATEDVDASTATGRFTRGMLAEIAAWESERIGDSWRETHARRLSLGLPHTGFPRFGYRYHKATGYTPDPDTGPVLVELYRRFARGDSARSLARWLNDAGVSTTRGGHWTAITVYRLLDAGFGAGLLHVRSSGSYLPGAQERLVDDRLWQAFLQRRRQGRRESPWVRKPAHALSGIIRCGECGATMTVSPITDRNGTKRRQYRCALMSAGGPCRGVYIGADIAERAVREWVQTLAADLEQQARVAVARLDASTVARHDRAHWARQVATYDRQLTRLTVDLAQELVPPAAYAEARDEIAGRRAEAETRLQDSEEELARLSAAHRPAVQALASTWDDMSVQGRRDALRLLLRRVEVRRAKGDRLTIVPVWVRLTGLTTTVG